MRRVKAAWHDQPPPAPASDRCRSALPTRPGLPWSPSSPTPSTSGVVALPTGGATEWKVQFTSCQLQLSLYFEQLRRRGLTVIDETWVPAYLDSFVEGGDLRGIVAAEDWDDLGAWAQAAIEDIDAKRSGFVDSLSVRETTMLMKIDDAFARTMNANANVTAYLRSLLKAEGMQNQMLQVAGLKELRDEITAGLAEASRFVAEATGTDGDPPGRED